MLFWFYYPPQRMIIFHEDNLIGRQACRKTSLQEDDLTGRKPHRKTNSQEDELGTAQPQLVLDYEQKYTKWNRFCKRISIKYLNLVSYGGGGCSVTLCNFETCRSCCRRGVSYRGLQVLEAQDQDGCWGGLSLWTCYTAFRSSEIHHFLASREDDCAINHKLLRHCLI